jgi:hypothetical protein
MNKIEKKYLHAIALFSFAYKGNFDDPNFENNDAGIELENMAFNLVEDTSFDLDEHMSYLSRATVLERCSLMIEQLVGLVTDNSSTQDSIFVAITDNSEFKSPEYLFNHEERINKLNVEVWKKSDLSENQNLTKESILKISGLSLFEGIITDKKQDFSVFRVN